MYYKQYNLSKSEPSSKMSSRQTNLNSVAKYIEILEKCGLVHYIIRNPIIPVFRLLNSCFFNNKEFSETLKQHEIDQIQLQHECKTLYPIQTDCIGSMVSLIYYTKHHGNGIIEEEHNKSGLFSTDIWRIIISVIYNQDWDAIEAKVIESLVFKKPLVHLDNDNNNMPPNPRNLGFSTNLVIKELLEIVDNTKEGAPSFKIIVFFFAFLLLPHVVSGDLEDHFALSLYIRTKKEMDTFHQLKAKTRTSIIYIRDIMEFIIFILKECMLLGDDL